jgi:hypothetical protein
MDFLEIIVVLLFVLCSLLNGKSFTEEQVVQQINSLQADVNDHKTFIQELIVEGNYEAAAAKKKKLEQVKSQLKMYQDSFILFKLQKVTSPLVLPINAEFSVLHEHIEQTKQRISLTEDIIKDCLNDGFTEHHNVAVGALSKQRAHLKQLEQQLFLANENKLHNNRKILKSEEYAEISTSIFERKIGEFVKKHTDALQNAKADLAQVLHYASLSGTALVDVDSVISETGYITLAFMNSAKRFNDFVAHLMALSEKDFGVLLGVLNQKYFSEKAKKIPRDTAGPDKTKLNFVCTFETLMATGLCKTSDGSTVKITEFELPSANPLLSRNYTFTVLSALSSSYSSSASTTTTANSFINDDEDNILRNIELCFHDSPLSGVMNESSMHDFMFTQFDQEKMFYTRVFFDGVLQPQFSYSGGTSDSSVPASDFAASAASSTHPTHPTSPSAAPSPNTSPTAAGRADKGGGGGVGVGTGLSSLRSLLHSDALRGHLVLDLRRSNFDIRSGDLGCGDSVQIGPCRAPISAATTPDLPTSIGAASLLGQDTLLPELIPNFRLFEDCPTNFMQDYQAIVDGLHGVNSAVLTRQHVRLNLWRPETSPVAFDLVRVKRASVEYAEHMRKYV